MSVVDNGDLGFSSACNTDGDRLGAGVKRVFDQLLDDGCRALDDLAGCDSIDRSFRQPADRH